MVGYKIIDTGLGLCFLCSQNMNFRFSSFFDHLFLVVLARLLIIISRWTKSIMSRVDARKTHIFFLLFYNTSIIINSHLESALIFDFFFFPLVILSSISPKRIFCLLISIRYPLAIISSIIRWFDIKRTPKLLLECFP